MASYSFKISGKEYDVNIDSIENGIAKVSVNGKAYEVELGEELVPAAPVAAAASQAPAAGTPATQAAPASAPAAKPAGKGAKVSSPLPGVIIEISVKEGQAVKAGQKVAVIEAMKMENEIAASQDGTITAIHVNKGDSVLEGADIVTIA